MIKEILVKKFDNFVDRSNSAFYKEMPPHKVDLVWRKQMTSLSGEEWKEVRSTFSPIFTSGKLKSMMSIVNEVADKLVQNFGKLIN